MRLTRALRSAASAAASSSSAGAGASSTSTGTQTLRFPWPTSPHATPYEIFHLTPSCTTAEVKRRYYELVKLYHPDKAAHAADATAPASTTSGSAASVAADNERFHKIVAANDLLTDRARRAAFDRHGVGWAYSGPGAQKMCAGHRYGSRFDAYNTDTPRWARRTTHADTAQWDNFYDRRPAAPGERVFTSNANFMGMVAFLCAVGAVFQAFRLGKASAEINGRADRHHFEAARDLAESRRLARDLGKDERIRLFLAQRSNDARGYAWDASRDDVDVEAD